MQRNLGREKVTNITNSEEWGCLVCEPKQIYDHKARYFSLYRLNKIPGFRKSKVKEKRHNLAKRKSNTLSRKAEKILESSHDFIEENIGKNVKHNNRNQADWQWGRHSQIFIPLCPFPWYNYGNFSL